MRGRENEPPTGNRLKQWRRLPPRKTAGYDLPLPQTCCFHRPSICREPGTSSAHFHREYLNLAKAAAQDRDRRQGSACGLPTDPLQSPMTYESGTRFCIHRYPKPRFRFRHVYCSSAQRRCPRTAQWSALGRQVRVRPKSLPDDGLAR
jgi:hypothetical protein